MTRKPDEMPTESELEILRVLWSRGPLTVREVHDVLSRSRRLGYTGTLKLMQNMAEKKLAARDESQRSHVYQAVLREAPTQRKLVKELLNTAFSGSADKLIMQALSVKKITDEELAEIRRMLDELEDHRQ